MANSIRMILSGSIESSSSDPSEKVGVVSVVYVSEDENRIRTKLNELQKNNPDNFYMDYVVSLDTDLTTLDHYPSLEISREDLQQE